MKVGDLVLVDWLDSCGPTRKWWDASEAANYGVAVCHTVGWVMRHDKEVTVIAGSRGDDDGDEVGDLTGIPTVCIVRVHKMRVSK